MRALDHCRFQEVVGVQVVVEEVEEGRLLRRKVAVVEAAAWRQERAEGEVDGLCWVVVVEVLRCSAGKEEVEEERMWVPLKAEGVVGLLVHLGLGVVEVGVQECEEGVVEVDHPGMAEVVVLVSSARSSRPLHLLSSQ